MSDMFSTHGESMRFMDRAREMVYDYIRTHVAVDDIYSVADVTVVWFDKTTKTWAATLTTRLHNNIFYRVSHDAMEALTTLAVYDKFDIQTFRDEEKY